MIITGRDLIRGAFKGCGALGVGQTIHPEQYNDAGLRLNMMIAQWARKRWLVYRLEDLSVVSTGAKFYRVGPGEDFDISVRPDRLEYAYARQLIQSNPNQADYPLRLLEARQDYAAIVVKNLGTFPAYAWYDPKYPVGEAYAWPIPQANLYEFHILVKMVLDQITDMAASIILPDEYFGALLYNLTVRCAEMFNFPPQPATIALAKDGLNVLRKANAQIPRLRMPAGLLNTGWYNGYSDRIT